MIVGYGRGGVAESFVYDNNIVVNGEGADGKAHQITNPLTNQPQPTPQATN